LSPRRVVRCQDRHEGGRIRDLVATDRDELKKAKAAADRALDRLIKLLVSDDAETVRIAIEVLQNHGIATLARVELLLLTTKDAKLRHRLIALLNGYSAAGVDVVWLLQQVVDQEPDPVMQPAAIVALCYALARRAGYRGEMNPPGPDAPES
jgi:hypothetical protein